MIAQAFKDALGDKDNICIFASGVSNSLCADQSQYERESLLLKHFLNEKSKSEPFVYFGTCSVHDPELNSSVYVQHKLLMEDMVLSESGGFIVRLPQVAGRGASPHTLLSFLYSAIAGAFPVSVKENAFRNIIDVSDVVTIVLSLIETKQFANKIINVANVRSYSIYEIIETFEALLGKKAIMNNVPGGAAYPIDITMIEPLLAMFNIRFDDDYLKRTISRYYL